MPFNGSGVYTPPAADFPVVTNTVISSTHFNNTINDIATALSDCMTRDGQGALTANLNMGGFKITNLAAGSAGAPGLYFSTDTSSGLYRPAANQIGVSASGAQVANFTSAGLTLPTGVIDSGSTTSLLLKTNGQTGVELVDHASIVNFLQFAGRESGVSPRILATGTDANVGLTFITKAAGNYNFFTDLAGGGPQQFAIQHTASATRFITVTGSNGGNPTISTTAGSLAITPAVVMASTLSAVGITVFGARFQGAKGANLTTANNLTLGSDGNYFTFSGGTQVNLIDSTGWQAGSIVTLVSGVLTTIKNNQGVSGAFKPIILQGAADFAMNANASLTLAWDGTQWFEIARRTP